MLRMARPVALAGLALLLTGAYQDNKEKREEDERCAVFVSEPDEQDDASIEVMKAVKKEIRGKKKWFRLLDDSPGATVSVELKRFGKADELKAFTQRTETGTSGQADGANLPALLDVESGYVIEFDMTVTDQFKTTFTATGRGRGSAAQSLARHVHTICDTYRE